MKRLVIAFSLLLPACDRQPEAPPSGNRLVLSLGGPQASLQKRLALHARGRQAPAPQPQSDPAPDPQPDPGTPPRPQPDPVEDPPRPQPQPTPEPSPYRVVRLPHGKTLYRLCVEQLGDGSRWKEVAALNGWREQDLSRLPDDQPVKLPRR